MGSVHSDTDWKTVAVESKKKVDVTKGDENEVVTLLPCYNFSVRTLSFCKLEIRSIFHQPSRNTSEKQ